MYIALVALEKSTDAGKRLGQNVCIELLGCMMCTLDFSMNLFWVVGSHSLLLFLFSPPKISLNDFSIHRIIGRGGFGEVYGCRKDDSGRMWVTHSTQHRPSSSLTLDHIFMMTSLKWIFFVGFPWSSVCILRQALVVMLFLCNCSSRKFNGIHECLVHIYDVCASCVWQYLLLVLLLSGLPWSCWTRSGSSWRKESIWPSTRETCWQRWARWGDLINTSFCNSICSEFHCTPFIV